MNASTSCYTRTDTIMKDITEIISGWNREAAAADEK
jgi:hypothetical protein